MSTNHLQQRSFVKIFEGDNLITLEKQINECIKDIEVDNYSLKNAPDLTIEDNHYIFVTAFEFTNLKMVHSQHNEFQTLEIFSGKSITELEEKINSSIRKKEGKNFHLHSIASIKKQSNLFVTSLYFQYCNLFSAH